MQQLFPFARSVDGGGFIQLAVHARQCGKIDDGAPAYLLPYAGHRVNGTEIGRILQQGNPRSAEQCDDIIKKSRGQTEILDHTAGNYQ